VLVDVDGHVGVDVYLSETLDSTGDRRWVVVGADTGVSDLSFSGEADGGVLALVPPPEGDFVADVVWASHERQGAARFPDGAESVQLPEPSITTAIVVIRTELGRLLGIEAITASD
jgi:hypothetical protein